MSFRNAFGIYHVLKQHLENATDPQTCVDLFDHQDVKQFAEDANRVSDYLGHMFRRGLLTRTAAPRTDSSAARYAYLWKNAKAEAPKQRNVQPRLEIVQEGRRTKNEVQITEHPDGSISVELSAVTITIKPK